ncbi:MAG: hypothetical protein WA655_01025 [Candidatus Korobacteraceae bacterium]
MRIDCAEEGEEAQRPEENRDEAYQKSLAGHEQIRCRIYVPVAWLD